MTALSSSVHLHARPETKEQLLRFFTEVRGVNVAAAAKAYIRSPDPMYAVTFSNGATLSVEFAQDALSDRQAQRGAWFELRANDAEALQERRRRSGSKEWFTRTPRVFYTQAPGGQVLRIVSDWTRER